MVTDAHSYENLARSSFGIPKTKAGCNEWSFSFGLTHEKQEILKTSGQKHQKTYTTQRECATYYAEIEDLEKNPPPVDPSLKWLVDNDKGE